MQTARAVALTGSDQTVRSGHGTYYDFTVRETSGSAAAVVRVYDGTSASGTIVEEIGLAQSESAREFYPGGVRVDTGIFVDVVSGAVSGSIRVG